MRSRIRNLSAFLVLVAACLALLAACSRQPQLPRLASDATILCFGDSITYGTGATTATSYPAVLAGLLGRRVVNAGIPGEVSADGLARLPEVLDQERPALLILCHGGNDLLQHRDRTTTAANLKAMVRLAQQRGVAVVLLAVPAPDLSLAVPKFYAEVARECQVPVELKSLPKILRSGSLKSDMIHPNAGGYQQLAEAVAQLLRRQGAI